MSENKAPKFLGEVRGRIMKEDDTVELEVRMTADPPPEFKWYHGEELLEEITDRISYEIEHVQGDEYHVRLTIKKIVDEDSGLYVCKVVNKYGKGNARFNVNLNGFSAPSFVAKPRIQFLEMNDSIIMSFHCFSLHDPKFQWTKDGVDIEDCDTKRITIELREECENYFYSSLEISNKNPKTDRGVYACKVKNKSGPLMATFDLSFKVPDGAPRFIKKPVLEKRISSQFEPCLAFEINFLSETTPTVIWINKKQKKMKESARMKFFLNPGTEEHTYKALFEFTDYKHTDSGTYTCNIRNENGEANTELTVKVAESANEKENSEP